MPRPRRSAPRPRPTDPAVGLELELEVGPVAHGGHCVARHEGRVVFVRHTLPGERVLARVTEGGSRFWRADAVAVREASPDRVAPAWPAAGAGGVGGAELSHVALDAQRRWKADVVAEQLQRLAGLTLPVMVESAPGDDERGGLGYRTRVELVTDAEGRAGMRRFRSHDVVPLDAMPLGTDDVAALAATEDVFGRRWRPGQRIDVVAPADGGPGMVLVDGVPWRRGRPDQRPNARRSVTESVRAAGHEHRYRVAADGFWQVHREAPAMLTEAVLSAAGDVDGARVLDLYAGAGLFTLPLAAAVGDRGRVVSVESDARAVKDARRNAHDRPRVELHQGAVDRVLLDGDASGDGAGDADVVVLDPPRAGAGRAVVDAIADLSFLGHFDSISRGVVDLRDLVYFGLVIGFWLAANRIVIELKKAQ